MKNKYKELVKEYEESGKPIMRPFSPYFLGLMGNNEEIVVGQENTLFLVKKIDKTEKPAHIGTKLHGKGEIEDLFVFEKGISKGF